MALKSIKCFFGFHDWHYTSVFSEPAEEFCDFYWKKMPVHDVVCLDCGQLDRRADAVRAKQAKHAAKVKAAEDKLREKNN